MFTFDSTNYKIRIFVKEETGEETEITDLYWFEENGVEDWDGEGLHSEIYYFRFEVEEK